VSDFNFVNDVFLRRIIRGLLQEGSGEQGDGGDTQQKMQHLTASYAKENGVILPPDGFTYETVAKYGPDAAIQRVGGREDLKAKYGAEYVSLLDKKAKEMYSSSQSKSAAKEKERERAAGLADAVRGRSVPSYSPLATKRYNEK
jgi:hypothetical protein